MSSRFRGFINGVLEFGLGWYLPVQNLTGLDVDRQFNVVAVVLARHEVRNVAVPNANLFLVFVVEADPTEIRAFGVNFNGRNHGRTISDLSHIVKLMRQ